MFLSNTLLNMLCEESKEKYIMVALEKFPITSSNQTTRQTKSVLSNAKRKMWKSKNGSDVGNITNNNNNNNKNNNNNNNNINK